MVYKAPEMLRDRVRLASVAVFTAFAVGCAVPVAAALDEPEANRVVVALDQSGIDAAKEIDPTTEGKYRVTVARDDVGRALATMREEELPRPKTHGVLDATDRGQLVPSQAAEHAQLVAGLAGELEKTLGGIENVLAARVHLNLPPREPLRDGPPAKATASVLIEHRGTTPPLALESIQRLVAGGVPGVIPNEVVVVFVPRTARAGGGRTDLAHVGPITVARGSMNTLKIAFASFALLVVALAAATLALWTKTSRLRREREVELAADAARAAAARVPVSPRSAHPAMSGGHPGRPSGGHGGHGG
jgi:type III secretion protein J